MTKITNIVIVIMEDKLNNVRYRFFNSEHIKEIIFDIDTKAYDDNKPEYANAKAFFDKNSLNQEFVNKLENALSKYGD